MYFKLFISSVDHKQKYTIYIFIKIYEKVLKVYIAKICLSFDHNIFSQRKFIFKYIYKNNIHNIYYYDLQIN